MLDEVQAVRRSRGMPAASEEEEEARPLDAEEWRQVLVALGWVDEMADDGIMQREARRAEKLLHEARLARRHGQTRRPGSGKADPPRPEAPSRLRTAAFWAPVQSRSRFVSRSAAVEPYRGARRHTRRARCVCTPQAQPIARFEPAEREAADEWSYALLDMPAVHVRGSFAFWQRGLPPHRIYPALSARMPAAVFQGSEGGGSLRARGAAKAGARAQCLVIELGAVHELQTSCPAANPYLVAELGGQQLLCQPLLGCEGPRAAFNQRFVVFLGAHAPPDGAKLRLRVMHKQVETPHGERQSVGGPPHIGSELAAELDEQLDRALSAAQAALRADWEAAREAKRASTGGTFSSLMSLLGFGSGSSAGAHEAGEAWAERPPPAPADLLLGEGEIELALALRQGGAAEVRVQLTQPVAELLRQRMLAEQLTSLFAPWAAAATAAEAHDLVPAGGVDSDDGDADADADADANANANATERAAGWAHKVLATVQADLVTVKVPVGEVRLSLSLFEWDERSLHVAQQVPACACACARACT